MKVIIIGAGIAGLTLGVACQRAGIEVKIYEKAQQLRNIGGGILLWPHGLRYLQWLGLSHCLKPFQLSINGCHIVGQRGQTIFSENYSTLFSLIDGNILPIARHHLQQALLNEIDDNCLTLGKTCVAIQQEENQAHAIFADGTQDSADMIVGADGIHSVARTTFNDQASLEYTHHCWWGGIIDQKQVPNLPLNEVFMAMGPGKMCIAWPTSNDKFMWYLPVKMPLAEFEREGDGLPQLQSLCADWNAVVNNIINAPSNEKRFHLPIYTLAPQRHWTHHRVVLIGDAAHTLGPVLGQGASQAIEDVFSLMKCLENRVEDIPDMLKFYETFRRARYQRMSELENNTAAMMIHENRETLALFEEQANELNLTTIYQDVIPLVDESACLRLSADISLRHELANKDVINV